MFKIFPYFPLLQYISPCFAKIIIFPSYFYKFPPVFEKFACFTCFTCISFSPYFNHEGPSIKYVTLPLANFYPPPPVTLRHTSRDPPRKYVTHLGPPPPI